MDGKLNTNTSGGEGVLANFFNSLLHKKSGGSPQNVNSPRTANTIDCSITGPIISGRITPARTDAVTELGRLAQTVNKEMDFTANDC